MDEEEEEEFDDLTVAVGKRLEDWEPARSIVNSDDPAKVIILTHSSDGEDTDVPAGEVVLTIMGGGRPTSLVQLDRKQARILSGHLLRALAEYEVD